MPRRIVEVWASWNNEDILSYKKQRWRIVPACIRWTNVALWMRSKYFSLGSRLTLTTSFLDALSKYMMFLFHIPRLLCTGCKNQEIFFLGQVIRRKKRRGFHLVKMEISYQKQKSRQDGVKNCKNQSKAIKAKQLWRYSYEPHAFWSSVMGSWIIGFLKKLLQTMV